MYSHYYICDSYTLRGEKIQGYVIFSNNKSRTLPFVALKNRFDVRQGVTSKEISFLFYCDLTCDCRRTDSLCPSREADRHNFISMPASISLMSQALAYCSLLRSVSLTNSKSYIIYSIFF